MSRQPYQLMISFVLGMSLLVTPCQGDSVKELVASNEVVKATLLRVQDLESGRLRFDFEVQILGGETSLFRLENQTRRVEKLHLFNTKLVVLGIVDSSISGVTVVDLESLQVLDFLLCYHPETSSTGRYVVYQKFYPRFAPPEVRSDLVLVYDLTRSPQDNRLGKDPLPSDFRPNKPDYSIYSEQVGFPIYPVSNAQQRSYRVWVDTAKARHHVMGKFLWDWRDEWVLFVDTEGETKGSRFIVMVDLSRGLTNPKVAKFSLEDANFQDISPPEPREQP